MSKIFAETIADFVKLDSNENTVEDNKNRKIHLSNHSPLLYDIELQNNDKGL